MRTVDFSIIVSIILLFLVVVFLFYNVFELLYGYSRLDYIKNNHDNDVIYYKKINNYLYTDLHKLVKTMKYDNVIFKWYDTKSKIDITENLFDRKNRIYKKKAHAILNKTNDNIFNIIILIILLFVLTVLLYGSII